MYDRFNIAVRQANGEHFICRLTSNDVQQSPIRSDRLMSQAEFKGALAQYSVACFISSPDSKSVDAVVDIPSFLESMTYLTDDPDTDYYGKRSIFQLPVADANRVLFMHHLASTFKGSIAESAAQWDVGLTDIVNDGKDKDRAHLAFKQPYAPRLVGEQHQGPVTCVPRSLVATGISQISDICQGFDNTVIFDDEAVYASRLGTAPEMAEAMDAQQPVDDGDFELAQAIDAMEKAQLEEQIREEWDMVDDVVDLPAPVPLQRKR